MPDPGRLVTEKEKTEDEFDKLLISLSLCSNELLRLDTLANGSLTNCVLATRSPSTSSTRGGPGNFFRMLSCESNLIM